VLQIVEALQEKLYDLEQSAADRYATAAAALFCEKAPLGFCAYASCSERS
jgi:hypothetical protein